MKRTILFILLIASPLFAQREILIRGSSTDQTDSTNLVRYNAIAAGDLNNDFIFTLVDSIVHRADLTIGVNVTLKKDRGGYLTGGSGNTLTHNGKLDIGKDNFFIGWGTVTLGDKITATYPQWWGAHADSSDNRQAVRDAVAAAGVGGTIIITEMFEIQIGAFPNRMVDILDGQHMLGMGDSAGFKVNEGTDHNWILRAKGVKDIVIEHLLMLGYFGEDKEATSAGDLIFLQGVANSTVKGIRGHGGENLISTEQCFNVNVIDCYAEWFEHGYEDFYSVGTSYINCTVTAGRTYIGYHTGSDGAATLTDANASFPTGNDTLVGEIWNLLDNSRANITGNTATTISGTLAGGVENDWDTDETYVVVLDSSTSNTFLQRGFTCQYSRVPSFTNCRVINAKNNTFFLTSTHGATITNCSAIAETLSAGHVEIVNGGTGGILSENTTIDGYTLYTYTGANMFVVWVNDIGGAVNKIQDVALSNIQLVNVLNDGTSGIIYVTGGRNITISNIVGRNLFFDIRSQTAPLNGLNITNFSSDSLGFIKLLPGDYAMDRVKINNCNIKIGDITNKACVLFTLGGNGSLSNIDISNNIFDVWGSSNATYGIWFQGPDTLTSAKIKNNYIKTTYSVGVNNTYKIDDAEITGNEFNPSTTTFFIGGTNSVVTGIMKDNTGTITTSAGEEFHTSNWVWEYFGNNEGYREASGLTVASDEITVFSQFHEITGATDPDTIKTISGGWDGMDLTLVRAGSNVVVVEHDGSTIINKSGADETITLTSSIRYRKHGSAWIEQGGSAGGGGDMLKADVPDSILANFSWRAENNSPAAGDTILVIINGILYKVDVGDLPASGGDITAVNVNAPVTGGGASGAVTISVDTSAGSPNLSTQYYVLNKGYITATLTQEEVEDIVGGMLDGTETLIAVTYQDAAGNIDFVVDEASINHDNLTNFAANEHYLQSAITATGTIASGVWNGTAIANADIAAGLDAVKIADGTVTNAEFQYINSLSSNVQDQIGTLLLKVDFGDSLDVYIGSTPGGELEGTWTSPTVDATHSGSSHHAAATVNSPLTIATQDLSVTVAKDIVATSPLTVDAGTNLDNVIIGTDADITIAIGDADDDGSTKGAASFDNGDFNATSGNVTIVDDGHAHTGASISGLTGADVTDQGLNVDDIDTTGVKSIITRYEYEAVTDFFMFAVDSASGLTSDTTWFAQNTYGAALTIDSIRVVSSTDDHVATFYERGWAGGGTSTIDVVTASTNGTACFYSTETSITDGSIAVNSQLGMLKPTITSKNILVIIYFKYTRP